MTSIRSILKIAQKIQPSRSLVVWDSGHSKWRKQIYPEYKRRDSLDEEKERILEEWRMQTALLERYLPDLGIGQIKIPGCEADDLIFRIQRYWKEYSGGNVVIASSDADFIQLIDSKLKIFNLASEKLLDEEFVVQEYGIRPSQWVEYRAMTGDGSDNIDGVPGVGPARASSILKEYGCVEEFLNKRMAAAAPRKWELSVANSNSIVRRNVQLMSLQDLPDSEIPIDKLEKELLEVLNQVPNHENFWLHCKRHRLNSVMEDRAIWSSVFKG
jgi:DNA polymerase-1